LYTYTVVVIGVRAGITINTTRVCKTGYGASQTVAAKWPRSWLKHFVGLLYRLQRTTTAPLPLVSVQQVSFWCF